MMNSVLYGFAHVAIQEWMKKWKNHIKIFRFNIGRNLFPSFLENVPDLVVYKKWCDVNIISCFRLFILFHSPSKSLGRAIKSFQKSISVSSLQIPGWGRCSKTSSLRSNQANS